MLVNRLHKWQYSAEIAPGNDADPPGLYNSQVPRLAVNDDPCHSDQTTIKPILKS